MVARGVEDPLERTQVNDDLCVDPELIQKVDLVVHNEVRRWENQCQWGECKL